MHINAFLRKIRPLKRLLFSIDALTHTRRPPWRHRTNFSPNANATSQSPYLSSFPMKRWSEIGRSPPATSPRSRSIGTISVLTGCEFCTFS